MKHGTNLFWQIILVLLVVLVALWCATEWAAWSLGWSPRLGEPLFVILDMPVYVPWAFFGWWYSFDAYAPDVVPPSDLSRTKPLMRLILNQVGRRLTEHLDVRPSVLARGKSLALNILGACGLLAPQLSSVEPKSRRRVLFMLDEFPALGRLDFFESALAYMAEVEQSERQYREAFPDSYEDLSNEEIVAEAANQWRISRDAFRTSIQVQSGIVTSIAESRETLTDLVGESQAATGNLSVAQAGNQLVALSVEQQMQMQQLMAAQYRMVALEESRRAAIEEQARIRHKRFVGDGVA